MCWSRARAHLGLSDVEFFRLTPRRLHLLMDRRREGAEHQELLAGIIAATVHNLAGRIAEKPLEAKDFMPSQAGKPKPTDRDKIAEAMRAYFGAAIAKQTALQEMRKAAGVPEPAE